MGSHPPASPSQRVGLEVFNVGRVADSWGFSLGSSVEVWLPSGLQPARFPLTLVMLGWRLLA